MATSVVIELSGDLAAIVTLPKQMTFAASRTVNDLLDRSQTNIQAELKGGLIIRGDWMRPGTRFGINARFSKVTNLEGSVGTAADWLLEEEGYHEGVKKASGLPNRSGYVSKGLAIPDVGNARPYLTAKMPPSQKAGKLLANTQRSKAFIVTSKKTGKQIVLQRVGQTAAGDLLRDKRGNLRIGRKSERTGGTKVVLKAIVAKSVKVPQKQIFVKTALNVMNISHFADRFGKNLVIALQTAKSK